MKIRNWAKNIPKWEKAVAQEVDKETAEVILATEAITAVNAASLLLQLPREVQNMIYELVLPGQQVIHVDYTHWTKRQFYLGPCYENSTEEDENSAEEEAELRFRTALEPSLLDTALLFACHQICREAEHTLYATNTFSFRKPDALHAFMRGVGRSPGAKNGAIRKIHLSVNVVLRHEGHAWNKALSLMVQQLPEVNNVCVTAKQRPRTPPGFQRTITNPAAGRNLFLRGILELRKLPLLEFDLIVSECDYPKTWVLRKTPTRWTHAQRIEWAHFVKSVVLGRTEVER